MQTGSNELSVKAAGMRSARAQGGNSTSPALWACWAFILVIVGRVHELIPGMRAVPLAKIAVGIWIVALFASPRPKNQLNLLSSPVYRSALVLAVLGVISVAFSIWPGQSLIFVLTNLSVLAITVVLIGKTLTDWQGVRGTWMCFVFAGAGLAIQGFMAYGGGRLVVDSMYDPNDLAYVLVTVTPLAATFAMLTTGWKRLAFAALAFLFVSIVFFLTQSRGGVLALAAMSVAFLSFLPRPKPVRGRAAKGTNMSALVFAGILVFGAAWTVAPSEAKQRIETIFSLGSDYNTDMDNKTGRMSMWTRNAQALLKRPIGFGINASPMVDLRNGGKFKAMHNSALQISVELGFLGLFFFVRAHWVAWRDLRRIAAAAEDTPENRERRLLLRAVCVGLVGNVVGGFFLTMAYANLVWTLLATMAVAALLLGAPANSDTKAPPWRRVMARA